MAQYTEKELLEFARKMLAQKEREKSRGKAYSAAVKTLISNHQAEFDKLYNEAKSNQGL